MTADPYRRQRVLWFAAMNLLAIAVAGTLFLAMLHGDGLNALFTPVLQGVFEYKLLAVLIALSPLFASLLIGMAYTQRALRRKKNAALTQTPTA